MHEPIETHAVRARRAISIAALLVVFGCPAATAADAIHKCRGADGSLHYQDEPCAPGTALPTPIIATAPEYEAPSEPALPAHSGMDAARTDVPQPRPPRAPPAPLFRCERYDGQEQYVTADPQPRRYQVPLWTVVGEAGAVGSAYTWVEDRCAPMTGREQCAHLAARRGEIATRRRTAFREELARLDDELARVRADLAAHCGG
ncbi:MAG TPA: DUF4124 domain-containing protein [Candidatus Saccharimonadia bacterium]|nr:DUF4124 domain-containing protein [Candidatus Saccharimonadia bacterium]